MFHVQLSTTSCALLTALSGPYYAASPSLRPSVALPPLAKPEMAFK